MSQGPIFPRKISFDRFKKQKPPILPYVLKFCMDEVVERTQTEYIRAQPSALKSLIINAEQAMEDSKEAVLELMHHIVVLTKKDKENERRIDNLEKEEEMHRITLFQKCHSHVILAAVFEFLNRLEGEFAVTVDYPRLGYMITGPPILDENYDSKNEAKFTFDVECFVTDMTGKNPSVHPVQRDILVYLLFCLTKIVSLTADSFRSKPCVAAHARRIVANKFGPILFRTVCECGSTIDDKPGCQLCASLCNVVIRPKPIATLFNLLYYCPVIFWQDFLVNPRPNELMKPVDDRKDLIRYVSNAQEYFSKSTSTVVKSEGKSARKSKEKKKKKEKKEKKSDKKPKKGKKGDAKLSSSDAHMVSATPGSVIKKITAEFLYSQRRLKKEHENADDNEVSSNEEETVATDEEEESCTEDDKKETKGAEKTLTEEDVFIEYFYD